MRVLGGSEYLAQGLGPFAMAIGVFDGVHLGHQALLNKARDLADSEDIQSLAYTFDPHPAQILNPALAPKLIEPVEHRVWRLAQLGMDAVVVEPFHKQYASQSPQAFVENVLVGKLHAKHVVVGGNFTYGARGAGNINSLTQEGQRHGFAVHALELERINSIGISSTKIRNFLSEGVVDGAAMLLGRPYELIGHVVRGAARGKKLGFPTANVAPLNEMLPAVGVYAVFAEGPFGRKPAVVNIGTSPTFGELQIRVECHVLNLAKPEDFYGERMHLHFVGHIRDERKFHTVEDLRAQITKDILHARELLE